MSSLSIISRRGITVLTLLLLIIALAVGGFFLVRYLQTRPATTSSVPIPGNDVRASVS